MKILHANLSRGFYGSERYCAELAAEQARDGNDVEVLIHDSWSACAREMRKSVALANTVGAGTMRIAIIPRWAPIALHRWFARWAFLRFRPDVVHTHRNPAARRIGKEAEALGIPHVATLHGAYDAFEVGNCDGLICVSAWQRTTIENFSGEVAVVHNWVPTAIADALTETSDAFIARQRRAWSEDNDVYVFGSAGQLVPEKGMARLVRQFRRAFPAGNEPVRLVIAGDGPQSEEIAQSAAGDARVILAGTLEDMAVYYLGIDAFISAAQNEAFGLAILEAMAAGCPLVLTRTLGPSEFVTDERVLWVDNVEGTGEGDAMAARLMEMFARGRERYVYDLEKLSQEHAADAIEALYRHVIARRRGPTS
jgi:glycosyltransferase involved in cell wall biosynthesis